ncbi:MAG TPA: hypothetical protein VIG40_03465 [Tissierellaceae bacterium]
MTQPNRNFEKEVYLLQQQLTLALSDKVMIQAMLDDALAEINKMKEEKSTELE